MTNRKFSVKIDSDYISINNESGQEVIGWHRDEWEEDPEFVMPAIGNAMFLAYNDPNKLESLVPLI